MEENTNLKNFDVIVLDYGLSAKQKSVLKEKKVIVKKCVRDGHVNIIRFRDMHEFLEKHKYDQILAVDSGDLFFQGDITPAFETDKDYFRGVFEEFRGPYWILFSLFFPKKYFEKNSAKKIRDSFRKNKMINAGAIYGPADKFVALCEEFNRLLLDRSKFGPDQVVINYLLYKLGFKQTKPKYNYVIWTVPGDFYIKDGAYYFTSGEKITVVHNAGGFSFNRPITNFGYGKSYNKLKLRTMYLKKFLFKVKFVEEFFLKI